MDSCSAPHDHAPYRVHHDLTGLAGGHPRCDTRRWSATARDGPPPPGRTGVVGTPAPRARPGTTWSCTTSAPPGTTTTGASTPGATSTRRGHRRGPAGSRSPGEDSYGRFAWVKLKPGAKNVGFLVVDKDGNKDVADDRTIDVDQDRRGLGQAGRPGARNRPGRPPPANPTRRSTRAPRSSTTARPTATTPAGACTCGTARPTPTDWSAPLLPERIDATARCSGCRWRPARPGSTTSSTRATPRICPTTSGSTSPGSATRSGCWAGCPAGCCPRSSAGRPRGTSTSTKQQAQWIDRSTVAWADRPDRRRAVRTWWLRPGRRAERGRRRADRRRTPHCRCGAQRNGLTEAQRAAFPHLWSHQAFTWTGPTWPGCRTALRGQVVVDRAGRRRRAALARPGCRSPGVLDDVYRAATDATLGVTFAGRRPRSRSGRPPPGRSRWNCSTRRRRRRARWRCAATTAPASGRSRGSRDWTGRYYRYRVEAWQPAAQKVVTASVTDPYSVALVGRLHAQPDRRPGRPGAAPRPAGPGCASRPRHPRRRRRSHELRVRDFSIADTHRAGRASAAPTWPSPTRAPPG